MILSMTTRTSRWTIRASGASDAMKTTHPLGCLAALLSLLAWLPRRVRALAARRHALRDPHWPPERHP